MSDHPLRLGRLGQVSLFVRDTARAEAFYRDVLGLPHLYTFGDLAFFDLGGVRLYLDRKGDGEWRPGSVLYFLVDDIQAATADLEVRGVHFSLGPERIHTHADTGIEQWMAFFDDSEGNMLALMSQVAPKG
ncbi:MAG TPA: VOC family protein [Candidatus Limnocylindrales bacterium]|nr:VOC family protein [Candidatus Limnocylindrales bacterium]